MRNFIITYKEKKDKTNFFLHKHITISRPCGDIGRDAKSALGIFMSCTGNLKKIDVISIQEVDEKGLAIGEPITPMAENAVLPTSRK